MQWRVANRSLERVRRLGRDVRRPQAPDGSPRSTCCYAPPPPATKAVASVIDLHALVCPGGRYMATYGGLPLRLADGIHFVTRAIALLADTLLPQLRAATPAADQLPIGAGRP
jgi:hypothetical protein